MSVTEEIIDAEVLSRATVLRGQAAEKAKAAAAASGRTVATGCATLGRRYWRGIRTSHRSFLRYWNDVPGADDIDECEPGKREASKASHEKKLVRNRAITISVAGSALSVATSGLTDIHHVHDGPIGWGLVVTLWLALTGGATLVIVNVVQKRHAHGWLWPCSILGIIAAGLAAICLRYALDVPMWAMPTSVLVAASGWALVAGRDGDLFGDGEAPDMVAADARQAGVDPVAAAVATGRLPKDAEVALVQPGVVWGNQQMIWTATLDTGGASATVLLEPKVKAEFAARVGLSARRVVLTIDEDRGSRIHVTGIVGRPWKDGVRHPLMALAPVDLWQGVPWGVALDGETVTYRVEGVNALFGGESGAGKSTALAGVWGAFALAVHGGTAADLHVIDGGEVDTEPLRRAGLASSWTTDLDEGRRILKAVLAEVDRRQHLLAQTVTPDGGALRKVTPEFFAEHGLGFLLLAVDELATFTQRKGSEAAEFAETLRRIAQRARKTGVHLLLSTQSPSVDALDADARDVIPVRWCGRARSVDLAGKVLGRGAVGRGLDPRDLPDVEGVGWYSAPRREVIVRPYNLTDADLAAICRRGVDLRRGSRVSTAADDDRLLAARVADLIRTEGHTVPAGRVMLARDVATRLEMDQMQLRAVLGRLGIGTQKVWRADDADATNRAHYVLTDFPSARAM